MPPPPQNADRSPRRMCTIDRNRPPTDAADQQSGWWVAYTLRGLMTAVQMPIMLAIYAVANPKAIAPEIAHAVCFIASHNCAFCSFSKSSSTADNTIADIGLLLSTVRSTHADKRIKRIFSRIITSMDTKADRYSEDNVSILSENKKKAQDKQRVSQKSEQATQTLGPLFSKNHGKVFLLISLDSHTNRLPVILSFERP